MSHKISIDDLPAEGEKLDVTRIQKVILALFLTACGGGALCVLAAVAGGGAESLAYGWLFAVFYFFTLAAGGLFWVLLHHATNSGWGIVVRRQMENLGAMIPWVALLFIPLIFLREHLWEWMQIAGDKERLAHDHLMQHKQPYLNLVFWLVRFVVLFGLLTLGARVLRGFSLKQDESGDVKYTFWSRRMSCGWLPVFALSVTFLAVDWLMTLNYTWFSTMWGVYLFAGSALSSMALLIILVTSLRNLGYLKQVVSMEHYHIMGKLLLSFTIFWAYIAFSQYFLIWYANITEETQYFLNRNTGHWWFFSTALVLCKFFIPFLFLLQQPLKKDPRMMVGISVWILFAHLLDIYLIVIPEKGLGPGAAGPALPSILDLLAIVTAGAFLAYIFLRTLGKHSLYPCRDPRLQESVNLTN